MKSLILVVLCFLSISISHAGTSEGRADIPTGWDADSWDDHQRAIVDRAEHDQIMDMKKNIEVHMTAMEKIQEELAESVDRSASLTGVSQMVENARRIKAKALINGTYGVMQKAQFKLEALHEELKKIAARSHDLHGDHQ